LNVIIFTAGIVVLTSLIFAWAAQAQTTACNLRSVILGMLDTKYKEAPIGMGNGNGYLLEVFVSETGSFTIVSSYPNGMACLLASGNDWKELEKPKPGKKA
jgi:hypothetical protein